MNELLNQLLPESFLRLIRRARLVATRRHFESSTLSQTFTEIYNRKLWGDEYPFCSGSGSRGRVTDAYVNFVGDFIEKNRIKSVVDLGCGDFVIRSRIAPLVDSYVGVDVVPSLINHLPATHGSPSIAFRCLDITTDPLPRGDLCLVRQVFQHLSNQEILRTLPKLRHPFVLITEHHPSDRGAFNCRKQRQAPRARYRLGSRDAGTIRLANESQ